MTGPAGWFENKSNSLPLEISLYQAEHSCLVCSNLSPHSVGLRAHDLSGGWLSWIEFLLQFSSVCQRDFRDIPWNRPQSLPSIPFSVHNLLSFHSTLRHLSSWVNVTETQKNAMISSQNTPRPLPRPSSCQSHGNSDAVHKSPLIIVQLVKTIAF
jgi:hypothetical protein